MKDSEKADDLNTKKKKFYQDKQKCLSLKDTTIVMKSSIIWKELSLLNYVLGLSTPFFHYE